MEKTEEVSEQRPKKPMSHEDRLQLAAKLDKELDEFIEKLPRKKYEDGWPEDRWEEEMAKHPFFMKEAPKPGDELHPLYEGLAQLKYDPDENEPEELAQNYKEDGNFNFKYKNYRLAILSYTEGIKINCGNNEVQASLLNNRAAAHYFLKNYRSCLKDCQLALTFKSDYDKALIRAAKCCFEIKDYKTAVEYCDQILDKQKNNNEILDLRKRSINEAKIKERDSRRKGVEEKRKANEEKAIIKEILNRGYHIEGDQKGNISLKKTGTLFPELMQNRVFLNAGNNLVWPVAFVYPEYKIMDYIKQFIDNETFDDHLSEVFKNYPEWDQKKQYTMKNLNVYFETLNRKILKVDTSKTLGDILKMKEYVIKGGTPSFIILVKHSPVEKQFLKGY
ncbi:hypothetical protein NQ317_001132 [Molorchus minor]|uniref:Cns1/TTC4 wheel domain-containing protein n=1 Tax=Molorchus minor TaxID=1323400 RepID=A0ABQ9J6Z5_9CUCU|nr:hypothetical protein NQ317_001132 [Molorchus minor]